MNQMSAFKLKSKSTFVLLVIVIVAAAIWLPMLRGNKNTPVAPIEAVAKSSSKNKYAQTTDVKYLMPDGWAKISPSDLQAAGASSGIATIYIPITQFRVAIEPTSSSPSNSKDLNSQTLTTIKQFQNFKLLTSKPVNIDGQTAQEYTYKLGSDGKTEQELIVVLYKKRAFSLLFTGPDTNFQSQSKAIGDIVASFQLL